MTEISTNLLRDTGMSSQEIEDLLGVDNRLARQLMSGRSILNERQVGEVVQLLEDMRYMKSVLLANNVNLVPLGCYQRIMEELNG